MIPRTLPEQMADLYNRIAEIERRGRNRRRTGTIEEVDTSKGMYRVKLTEGSNGQPFITGWIKPRTLGAGNVKIDVVLTKGEQVDVTSESGDLTDAVIDTSSYSDSNARENTDTPLHIKIGGTTLACTGDAVTLTAGTINLVGNVVITGSGVTHNGHNIGDTHVHTLVVPGPAESGPPP